MTGNITEELGRTRHANIEAQRKRWAELREAAMLVDAQLEDGGVTAAAHERLARAIEATSGPCSSKTRRRSDAGI